MSFAIVGAAVAAVSCLLGGGYLLGVKMGLGARRKLRAQVVASHRSFEAASRSLEERERQLRETNRAMEELRGRAIEQNKALQQSESLHAVERRLESVLAPLASQEKHLLMLESDLRALSTAVGDRKTESATLRQDLERYLSPIAQRVEDSRRLRSDLQKMVEPVLARQREADSLEVTMRELLAPLAERERIGKELSALPVGNTRQDLPRLLESIADRAGFATVILSDEVGLPLAIGGNTERAETIAGASSLLLTYADRLVQGGLPAPLSLLLLDEANQTIVHRIFRAQGERYVLTAVARGTGVAPASLDPALDKLERMLARDAWA